MTESSNLWLKARDLLATPSHLPLAIVVSHLFMPEETSEFKVARTLFDFCIDKFPNCLTVMLLKVFRFSSNGVVRFQSIYLLSETLDEFSTRNFEHSLTALYDIKPLLISCLTKQETKVSDIKILRRIVTFVAYSDLVLEDDGWDELSGCILELANNNFLKAFHVFIDLPAVYGEFIPRNVVEKIEERAKKVLLNPEQCRAQDWNLALETVFKIGVQVSDLRSGLIKLVLNSAKEVVKKGKEEFLEGGLEDLKKFLARDGNVCKYKKDQRFFVSRLAFEIAECYKTFDQSMEVGMSVLRVVGKPKKYSHIEDEESGFERDWFDHLNNLSSLEILRIFASTNLEDRSRVLAIRRLGLLLADHTTEKVRIKISMMRELQPLLISCLWEERNTHSVFKILGEVVSHVAYEMMSVQDEKWYGLRDYIVSKSKTEFQKAVYIFQCLTVELDDKEFVIPMIDNLLPEITRSLNPPREFFVGNRCWVLAFVGAFCAAVHVIEISSHAESVKELLCKMVDSVRELVVRGMEVGLVRIAFRDVESIVKKQLKWYSTSEYRFVKGLLWRLYEIKAMKMESRMVLWRINQILERGVHEELKEIPKSELDWLSKPEA